MSTPSGLDPRFCGDASVLMSYFFLFGLGEAGRIFCFIICSLQMRCASLIRFLATSAAFWAC